MKYRTRSLWNWCGCCNATRYLSTRRDTSNFLLSNKEKGGIKLNHNTFTGGRFFFFYSLFFSRNSKKKCRYDGRTTFQTVLRQSSPQYTQRNPYLTLFMSFFFLSRPTLFQYISKNPSRYRASSSTKKKTLKSYNGRPDDPRADCGVQGGVLPVRQGR